jgi:hypothetical protein
MDGYVRKSCASTNNDAVWEFESNWQTTDELVGVLDLLPGSQLLLDVAVHVVSGKLSVMLVLQYR